MERRDLLIVIVGGLLVVGATAYAAVQPSPNRYLLHYGALGPGVQADIIPSGPVPPTGTSFTSHHSASSNVTRFFALYNVTTGSPGAGASAHATLTMPNGTKLEAEASGTGTIQLKFDVEVGPVPADTSVEAGSQAEADALLVHDARGAGDWSVVLSLAPTGTPVALLGATEYSALVVYVGSATAMAPNAK